MNLRLSFRYYLVDCDKATPRHDESHFLKINLKTQRTEAKISTDDGAFNFGDVHINTGIYGFVLMDRYRIVGFDGANELETCHIIGRRVINGRHNSTACYFGKQNILFQVFISLSYAEGCLQNCYR